MNDKQPNNSGFRFLLRQINLHSWTITQTLVLVLFVGMGYLFRVFESLLMEQPVSFTGINHFYLILGGIGTWLWFSYITTGFNIHQDRRGLTRKNQGLGCVTDVIAIFGSFAMFLLSIMLIMSSVWMPLEKEAEVLARQQSTGNTLALIVTAIIMYVVFYTVHIASLFQVQPDTIVKDPQGKIYYPGQVFRVWPWSNPDYRKIPVAELLHLGEHTLKFQDGEYTIKLITSIVLNLEKAQLEEICQWQPQVYDEASATLIDTIKSLASELTIGEFLKKRFPGGYSVGASFPYIWTGEVVATFVNSK